jgi:hypothetical protein
MFVRSIAEKDQWIPNEISYSLRHKTRGSRTSNPNAMLAVALPDRSGSYSYAVQHQNCVTTWQTHTYFNILSENMFNRLNKNEQPCGVCGKHHHVGSDHSYIHPVKWVDFINNYNFYIDHALLLQESLHEFDIKKMHD